MFRIVCHAQIGIDTVITIYNLHIIGCSDEGPLSTLGGFCAWIGGNVI